MQLFCIFQPLYYDNQSNNNYFFLLWSQQSFVSDGESSTAKLLSSTSEIGKSLFTTLETHFSMAMDDRSSSTGNNFLIQEQCKVLYEKLNSTITSLVLSETPSSENEEVRVQVCSCGNKVAARSQLSSYCSLIMILFSTILVGYFFSFFKILIL